MLPPTWIDPDKRRNPQYAEGVRELADEYDLWLIDQWGVLHGGTQPFPGVMECLRQLKRLGKLVVLLSNSGKRLAANAARLNAMGIGPDSYTAMVTSGELARIKLSEHLPPFDDLPGPRCLLLSSDGDEGLTQGTDLTLVAGVGDADFILLSGVDDELPRDFYQATFELGCARNLPLICANPDLIRITDEGTKPSAGAFAQLYEDLGGQVHYIGKPYEDIYRFCLDAFGHAELSRTVAVGDSLYHDIRGGVRAGLATVFVTDGIHRAEFAELDTPAQRLERLRGLARDYGTTPDWIIERFHW